MRYAIAEDLDRIEPLLAAIRQRDELTERKRGTFYLRRQAFLHFHEHAGTILADLRAEKGFDRTALDESGTAFLAELDTRLAAWLARSGRKTLDNVQ